MNTNEIIKAGVIGGIVAIVLEFIVGAVAMGAAYDFGFLAMLVGGFIAGWTIKAKQNDALVAGAVAGVIFVILGLLIIFPSISSYRAANPIVAIVIGIILGLVGAFIGQYLVSNQGSKSSRRK